MIEGKWAKVGSIGLHRRMRCLAALLLSGSMIPGFALAKTSQQPGSAAQLAQVKFIARGLTVQPPRGRAVKGKMNMLLFGHYGLQTGTGERASIEFRDGTILHMNERTDAVLSSPHVTFVKDGVVDEAVVPGSNHRVQTAAAIAAAVGTNFQIRISTSSLKASFTMVLRGMCRPGNYLQSFTLPKPVRVRYVELYAVDNYGNRRRLAVAELEVVGTSGYGRSARSVRQ